jgi:hypothetical protein
MKTAGAPKRFTVSIEVDDEYRRAIGWLRDLIRLPTDEEVREHLSEQLRQDRAELVRLQEEEDPSIITPAVVAEKKGERP